MEQKDENKEWRMLHIGGLCNLYDSHNIVRVIKIRRIRWTIDVARMKEVIVALNILTGKPIGKRSLEKPWRVWEDNIRMILEEIRINTRNGFYSLRDRDYWKALVNAILNPIT